jgi:putative ABC transport system permease protein
LHASDHEPFLWGSETIEALNFIALKMLLGDRLKYVGLLFGITFTAFLVTFAASYFGGMMTRSFALIAENSRTHVWVMDPAVMAVEPSFNLPASTLNRMHSVEGIRSAMPLALATAEARLPNGRFQSFQVIGVDDATNCVPDFAPVNPRTAPWVTVSNRF